MSDWLFRNPELLRYIQGSLKKRQFVGGIILYLIFLLLVTYLIFQSMSENTQNFNRDFFTALFNTLMVIQFISTFFMGSILCAGSLVREKEMHAYDFLRMIPLHPLKIVMGKLLGVPLLTYIMLFITLPATFLCALMAPLPLDKVVSIYLLLVVGGFFTHTLGLFLSAFVSKSQWASSSTLVAVLVLAGVFSMPQINFMHPLTYFFELFKDKPEPMTPAYFYGLPLPPVFLALCFYAILISFLMTGIYRHLENESQRLLSKKQALSFYGVTLLLIGGVFWRNLSLFRWDKYSEPFGLAALALTLFSLLCLLFFILTPSYESLVRWGYLKQAGELKSAFHEATPPLFLPLVFYGITLLFFSGVTEAWIAEEPMRLLMAFSFVVLFAQLYAFLFLFMNTFYTPFKGDALLLGLILLSWFIPIFQLEPSFHFFLNPFVVLVTLLAKDGVMTSGLWVSWVSVLALNLMVGLGLSSRLNRFVRPAPGGYDHSH